MESVINSFYSNPKYYDVCKKIAGKDYDDLHSYCVGQMLKKGKDFILEKEKEKKIFNYFFGIAYKSYNSTTSEYYKIYKEFGRRTSELTKDIAVSKNFVKKLNAKKVKKIIEKFSYSGVNNWAAVEIFNLFVDEPNYSSLSKKTSIPVSTIHNTVNKVRTFIKNELTINS